MFHVPLDASAALPSLRNAMKEDDAWLRLNAAEGIWIISGKSPKDITADALAVISESAHSELAPIRVRARSTMKMLDELGVWIRPST